MDVYETGGQREITMKLSGLTRALDYERKTIDYQDENKTLSGLLEGRISMYKNIRYDITCKDIVMSDFLLQYEETDYEFIKRILSYAEEPVYTSMEGTQGMVVLGLPQKKDALEITGADYEVSYGRCLYYHIKSDLYLDLGTQVLAYGRTLWVKEAAYSLKKGESCNKYTLCGYEDLMTKPFFNAGIIGISLDGKIQDRLRDKVKITLDNNPGQMSLRWFGYSSPAASEDGSGWYCMPETGEQIRLYCPSDNEKEAYVISAIRSGDHASVNNAGEGSAKEPANKTLSNVQGQMVSFTADGVSLNCADGSAAISLNKNGEIEITAQNDINLSAAESVNMRAEEGIVIHGGEGIDLTNDSGSTFLISENIDIKANRIKDNC